MNDFRGSRIFHPRLLLGLTVLAIGGVLLLSNLGFVPMIHWHQLWPLILIVLGLGRIISPRRHRGGGFILLFVGLWFLGHNLWDWDVESRYFLPILLLVVGGSMVVGTFFRSPRRWDGRGRVGMRHGPWSTTPGAAGTAGVTGATGATDLGVDGGAEIHPFAILGGARAASNSQAFRGGSATAMLGSCVLDLRDASIPEGQEAVVDATAFWGGVVILVPETWSVRIQGMPLLGGFHDLSRPAPGSTQRLVVSGLAVMGGVEVRNQLEREERY